MDDHKTYIWTGIIQLFPEKTEVIAYLSCKRKVINIALIQVFPVLTIQSHEFSILVLYSQNDSNLIWIDMYC